MQVRDWSLAPIVVYINETLVNSATFLYSVLFPAAGYNGGPFLSEQESPSRDLSHEPVRRTRESMTYDILCISLYSLHEMNGEAVDH